MLLKISNSSLPALLFEATIGSKDIMTHSRITIVVIDGQGTKSFMSKSTSQLVLSTLYDRCSTSMEKSWQAIPLWSVYDIVVLFNF
jgi:hypothetical protein